MSQATHVAALPIPRLGQKAAPCGSHTHVGLVALVGLFVFAVFAACGDTTSTPADVIATETNVPDVDDSRDTNVSNDTTTTPDVSVDTNPDTTPDGEPNDLTQDTQPSDLADPDAGDVSDTASSRCGNAVLDDGEDCDDGNAFNSDGCTTTCRFGPRIPQPLPGEVVIHEIMVSPLAAATLAGQWVELAVVGPSAVNLAGCRLETPGGHAALPETVLARGAFVVIGRNANRNENGNIPVDISTSQLLLDPASSRLALICQPFSDAAPTTIDIVAWTAHAWPVVSGRSLSLDPDRAHPDANDLVDSWCPAPERHLGLDRASPGRANPACPGLDRIVDACTLVPFDAARANDFGPLVFAGETAPIAVDVFERGLTDLSDRVDPTALLRVEVGFGSNWPNDDSWQWVEASPRSAGLRIGSDRYRGLVVPPTAGVWRTIGRASRDGGLNWTWCDVDGQSTPGLDGLGDSSPGRLDVLENPCATAACDNAPTDTCAADGVTALVHRAENVRCTPVSVSDFTCNHIPNEEDCTSIGRACRDGACDVIPEGPSAGDVAFNEVIIHPSGGAIWFELVNRTTTPLSLDGCALEGDGLYLFPATRVLRPGGFALVSPAPEFAPLASSSSAPIDFTGTSLQFEAAAGSLTLRCGTNDIAHIDWDFPDWSWVSGQPLGLSPWASSDTRAAWCTDDFDPDGTPGAPNAACPGDLVPIQTCRIIAPANTTVAAGTEVALSIRFKALPQTSVSNRTDPAADILLDAWISNGTAAPDPNDNSLAWHPAVPDTGWVATGSNVDAAEDRYIVRFRTPAPGTARVWVRATADGGNGVVLCDLDGIATNPASSRPVVFTTTPSVCDPDPCGAPPEPVCNGDTVVGIPTFSQSTTDVYAACTPDATDPTQPRCTWATAALENCAAAGASCRAGACVDFPRPPEPGEVVFSELMIIPSTGEDGEWIELLNPGPVAVDLRGCELVSQNRNGPEERWTMNSALSLGTILRPRSASVAARSEFSWVNGGTSPRFVWTGLSLDNAADSLALVCGGQIIDTITWDAASWPIPAGRALSLSAASFDANANDLPDAWCIATTATPNTLNPLCRRGPAELAACRVQVVGAPTSHVGDQPMQVLVDIHEPGLTDRTPDIDPIADTRVAVGLVPASTLGFSLFNIRNFDASPLSLALDATTIVRAPGDDRWSATFVPGVTGDWLVYARMSPDNGRTWRLCDSLGPVTTLPATPWPVTIAPGVCVPNPCMTPPAPVCSGSTIIWRPAPGACTRSAAGLAQCSYGTSYFSCWSLGGCDATTGTCFETRPTPNQPGDVVITEIMREPDTLDPAAGEWLEVQNPTSQGLDLRGCHFINEYGQMVALSAPGPDLLQAGARTVFWGSADTAQNGGQYVWEPGMRTLPPLRLSNVTGQLSFICNDIAIDTVRWGPGWPGRRGVAMQLSADAISADQNDDPTFWCEAVSTYGLAQQRGTPTTLNRVCF